MNKEKFRTWAINEGKNKKVISDTMSRLGKIERELGIDIEKSYKKDKCAYLLSLFEHSGKNDEMSKYNTSLPIGKYSMSTYKYAIKQYLKFKEK